MALTLEPTQSIALPTPAEPIVALPTPSTMTGNYAELKQLIKSRGLLERTPLNYSLRIVSICVMFAASIGILVSVHLFWVQMLNAVFLAFVSTQFGFIGHDAGHRQIFAATRNNDLVGLVTGNLISGMSFYWWLDKHNAHHAKPNEIDADPDISIPILAFTEDAARSRQGVARFITKHQASFFFPLLLFVAVDLQRSSIGFLRENKVKYPKIEGLFLVLHYIGYLGLTFAVLPIWQGVLFIVVHKLVSGLYLGSVFAPNHKGMLITESGSDMDFLPRQVLTARNVKTGIFADYWYGGLNYQIEHHLFPTLPRRNLAAAQRIIRSYCEDHGLSYYETGAIQSYREIIAYLHEVSAPLRTTYAAA